MKHNFYSYIIVGLMLFSLTASTIVISNQTEMSGSNTPASAFYDEENDDYLSAIEISSTNCYDYFTCDDEDWFFINITTNQTTVVRIWGYELNSGLSLSLYSENMTVVGSKGQIENEQIITAENLPLGKYYLSVIPKTGETGYYLEVRDYIYDDFYNNYDSANAYSLNEFSSYNVGIHEGTEEWLKINTLTGWTILFILQNQYYLSYDVQILDPNLNIISFTSNMYLQDDTYIYTNYSFTATLDGDYYIRIFNSNISATAYLNTIVIFGNPLTQPSFSVYTTEIPGVVEINWNTYPDTTTFYVFRSEIPFSDFTGMEPIFISSDLENSWYFDEFIVNGSFYYGVMSSDGSQNSSFNYYRYIDVNFEVEPINLYDIDPILDKDGVIYIEWARVPGSQIYVIYRDIYPITDVSGLTPIDVSNNSEDAYYRDVVPGDGTYYYVILVNNEFYSNQISECKSVVVTIVPLLPPIVDPLSNSINTDGRVYLRWQSVEDATQYYIFRSIYLTSSIDQMELIGYNYWSWTGFNDEIKTNGTYYYRVIASDGEVNSTQSNMVNVTIRIPPMYTPNLNYGGDNYIYNDRDGEFDIYWGYQPLVTSYYVFRDTVPFNEVGGREPYLNTTNQYSVQEEITTKGLYYYRVMATNGTHNTSLSKQYVVNVLLCGPEAPTIQEIGPNPNYMGFVSLRINSYSETDSYKVYRSLNTPITNLYGLTPIHNGYLFDDYLIYDNMTVSGTYYYTIVGTNQWGDSNMSVVKSVNVDIRPSPSQYTVVSNPSYAWIQAGSTIDFYWGDGYRLPFDFPFYDQVFSRVYIRYGMLSFTSRDSWNSGPSSFPSFERMSAYVIAPYWSTYMNSGSNVKVSTSTGMITFTWEGVTTYYETIGSFQVSLYADGQIKFQYKNIIENQSYVAGINYGNNMTGYNIQLNKPIDRKAVLLAPVDNFAPTIIRPVDIEIIEGNQGQISWNIFDYKTSSATYKIFDGNNALKLSGTWKSGDAIRYSLTDLPLGNYQFRIVVDDGFGLITEDIVNVDVISENQGNSNNNDDTPFDSVDGFPSISLIGFIGITTLMLMMKKRRRILKRN